MVRAVSTPRLALALVLSAVACGAGAAVEVGPGSADGSDIPERESVFATAEADRKSAAGDCRMGPGARCEGADFKGADLSWANLREADVEAAILCNTLMPDGGTRNDDC